MRGAPHNGFAVAISTINLRTDPTVGVRRDCDRSTPCPASPQPLAMPISSAQMRARRALQDSGAAAARPCSRVRGRGVRGRTPRSRGRRTESIRTRGDCCVSSRAESRHGPRMEFLRATASTRQHPQASSRCTCAVHVVDAQGENIWTSSGSTQTPAPRICQTFERIRRGWRNSRPCARRLRRSQGPRNIVRTTCCS